ncbi:SGNH/GDSL hydrolase family protein [Methylocystis sp. FS]|uniref:SGNH/GDSL hydrolase family protein n=1 Tax=Methylocystis silviterrae TaxID=2743612 RepID=UPI0015821A85|nr:SGNH/GDSL hydrolase family protein [Methylocystis silviterrae]NUJ79555.1 SGNH/GDSL hydrolase family protein [Methylocystis silviterrae]
MFPGAHKLAFVLAVASGLTLLSLKRSDEPTLYCANVNGGGDDYRILVIGESWASDGKVLPELPRAVSKRLEGRGVRACSLGFAGRNSRLLYAELREKFPKYKLYRMFEDKKPDKVVLMNGVNDAIQHIGASAYVEYTEKLVEYFADVDDVELISIPRVNERNFRPPNFYSALKRSILSCFYDDCERQVNDLYRVALWRDHPDLNTLEYDAFIDRYEGNERSYTADGVHLTDEYFHKYGEFIGGAVSLGKAAPAVK